MFIINKSLNVYGDRTKKHKIPEIFNALPEDIKNETTYSKMEKGDGLPQYGCLCCIQKLESVVTFMKQCEYSDRVLRKNLDTDHCKQDKKGISQDLIQDLKSFSLDYSSDDENQYSDTNNDDFANDSTEDITNKNGKNSTNRRKKLTEKETNTNEKAAEKNDTNDSEVDDFWAEFDVKPVPVKKTKIPSGYLCYYCGKEYPPGQCNAYRNHIMNYHSEKKFKCDKCHRVFFTQLRLEGHQFNFHQKEGRRFGCDMCDRTFESNKRLRIHKETIHLKSFKYECDVCSKVFYNKTYLKNHQKTHQTEMKCNFCDKTFCRKMALITHMRGHTGERPYSCRFCDSKFTIAQSLKEHERLHTGEKPFKCPACKKGFSQQGNMKSHFKFNHRELEFKETMAAFRLSLKKDKKTNDVTVLETTENGEHPFSCRFCSRKFTIAQSLKEHESLHARKKSFKCPACPREFSHNYNLKSHFKFNHKELEFEETMAAFQLSLKKDKGTDKVSNDAIVLEIEYIKGES